MNQCQKVLINLGFLGFLLSPAIFASNFAVTGVGVRGESLQAFTAVADDPSAIYYNPAGLTQLKGKQAQGSLMALHLHLDYQNDLNQVETSSGRDILGPTAFFTNSDGKLAYGVGIYSPFARKNYYTINPAVYDFEQLGNLVRLDVVPTMAYAITPAISVGAGLVLSRVDLRSSALGFFEKGQGYGATGQAGVMIQPNSDLNIGVNYRGPMQARINGWGELGNNTSSFNTDFRFPGTASAGFSYHFFNPLLFSFEYDYEMWSYVDQVQRHYDNALLNALATNPVNAKNTSIFRFGALYALNPCNELRIGYSYNPQSVPNNIIIPSQPDYNANIYSAGYSYYRHNWRFDLGYEYAFLSQHTGTQTLFPGQYKGYGSFILAGINYRFT